MNSSGKYEGDKVMIIDEEGEQSLSEIEQRLAQEAIDSYPENEEVQYCSICGKPMRYNSISYHEGFHIDSCI